MTDQPTSEPAAQQSEPSPDPVLAPGDAGRRASLVADVVDIERAAVGSVRATDVTARLAIVGGIASGEVSMQAGAVGGIAARQATVRQATVQGVVAREVRIEQALVRSVVAGSIHAGPSTGILVAIAGSIDGEAKVLLDWRGGLVFGAVFGTLVAAATVARRRR